MSSTREIKQRISNIESVSQLIDAMHMVSSTQLTRSNRQLDGAIPVQEALENKIHDLGQVEDIEDCPYYERRDIKNSLYLVFTGDMGLVGSYNSRIQKFALDQMKDKNEKIIVIGSYGKKFFERNKKNIHEAIVDIVDSKIYYGSESIACELLDLFMDGEVDEVFIVYTEFENVLTSKPVIKKVLPLPLADTKSSAYMDYEPSLKSYLDHIVPFYLHMSVFRAFSEAHTSEQASRMVAMDTAGTNADDLVENLQRSLNRQRQQEITQELSEIIGQNDY